MYATEVGGGVGLVDLPLAARTTKSGEHEHDKEKAASHAEQCMEGQTIRPESRGVVHGGGSGREGIGYVR
jgi:hypothetical protein